MFNKVQLLLLLVRFILDEIHHVLKLALRLTSALECKITSAPPNVITPVFESMKIQV